MYYHLANALRILARKWLFSVVDKENEELTQLKWSVFKDIFKHEYTIKTNEQFILEGLISLAMKPEEVTKDFINCVTDTMVIIKESYTE
jgi:hypothetical protein